MKTILHIEDEKPVIELIHSMLEGYNLISSTTAEKAIEILQSNKIDLVLLDLRINKEKRINGQFSGEDILKFINDHKIKTKVIIVSALSEESKRVMNDYKLLVKATITKPFLKKELINALNKVFKKRKEKI